MKIIAAYLLAVLGGNEFPSAKIIKSILGSVGVDADEKKIDYLLSQLEGKDITEVLASGREKLASVPAGGGGGGGYAVAAAGSGAVAAPAAAAAPVEEEEEKKEEESDEDMGFSLFD